MNVFDHETSPQGFRDDGNGVIDPNGDDYAYDENGNMTSDQNKGIGSIEYNHLNLPTKIVVGTNTIEYLYNATGQKVSKIVIETGIKTQTDYLAGGFQYKESELQFFPHVEGYVNVINSNGVKNYNYVFNYTDHLGNIRLSYGVDPNTGSTKILEENHYYPFGLKHSGYNMSYSTYQKIQSGVIAIRVASAYQPNYNYKYNEKEFQDELSLNLYNYGARNYDPAIGRWMNIDPLAEKYPHNGAYNFSENRVVDGRELEGLEVVLINPTKSSSTQQQKVADQRVVNGAKNIPNSNTLITVTGHGSPKGMSNDVRGGKIRTPEELNAVLNRNSDAWKNKESGAGMTVVLYSCRTGSDVKDKNGKSTAPSFAQTISGSEEFKDVEIIAPDQRVYMSEDGPVGTYEAEHAGPDDEYKPDAKDKSRSDTPGNWNVFKNGELIRSYQGDWQPTNNPSFFDTLFNRN